MIIRCRIPPMEVSKTPFEDIFDTLNSLQLSVVCTMENMKSLLHERYTLSISNLHIYPYVTKFAISSLLILDTEKTF